MTKDELLAANERLGAEIAALRELVAVIGTALPPYPADLGSDDDYKHECRTRLATVAIVAEGAMHYAGTRAFPDVLRNSAATLRKELGKPLPYVPESDGAQSLASVSAS